MKEPQPQVAFIAAFVALLVIPLLVLFGLSALGVAAGMMSRMDGMMGGESGGPVLALFLAWVLLVLALGILFIWRLTRRTGT